jgi:hypothetical protein
VLTQIAQSVLAEKRQSQQMVLQEEEAAYQRALAEAEAQQYYANIAAAAASTSNGSGNGEARDGAAGLSVDTSGLTRHPLDNAPTSAPGAANYLALLAAAQDSAGRRGGF